MKKVVLFVIALLVFKGAFSQLINQEYLQFRNTVVGLSVSELEEMHARPSDFYIKGFNTNYSIEDVHYLDSVLEKLQVTSNELELLQENRFVVTERLSHNTFGSAFHNVYSNDLPVFITTDAILHALHMSYDKILKTIEQEIMASNLEEYLTWLYNNFEILETKYSNLGDLEEGLQDVDLYITIAYSLITGQLQEGHVVPNENIQEIWDLIQAEQMASVSLFTYPERTRKIDFSQFTVRGHYVYTQEDEWQGLKSLEPYFRTMMWLGRIDFLLTPPPENPWELPWTQVEIQRMNIGAFMLNELAEQSTKKNLLEFDETVINYLVGESDNITPNEYGAILGNTGISDAGLILDSITFQNLQLTLNSDPALSQKILSDFYFMDPQTDEPGTLPISYRLSGQRFIIDSYILGNVVFDRLVQNGQKLMRMMPNPLDALFVLGNNDALSLLENEFEQFEYAEQLANLRFLVDQKPEDFWNGSLYNVWLNSIRELNPVTENDQQPLFMKTAAWHQEKINTQLSSWSQLRHDNLLYAKQSYTGGTGCSFPYSYIEPYPEFYSKIARFANDAGNFFSQLAGTNSNLQRIADFFPNFENILLKLETLAEKQLAGETFSAEETDWLKIMLFADGGSGMPPYSGWYTDLFFEKWDAAETDFTVVDIHTQPTDESGNVVGKVLHAGTGFINLGIFLVDCPSSDGNLMAYVGPVMSYYENTTNNFDRLTDQEWSDKVWDEDIPERPFWTNIYLADNKGDSREKSIELPSQLYVSTNEIPIQNAKLEIYPNPASNIIHVQVPKPVTDAVLELYSVNGVLMAQRNLDTIGGQTKQIKVSDLPEGVYLIRLSDNEREYGVSKFVKK